MPYATDRLSTRFPSTRFRPSLIARRAGFAMLSCAFALAACQSTIVVDEESEPKVARNEITPAATDSGVDPGAPVLTATGPSAPTAGAPAVPAAPGVSPAAAPVPGAAPAGVAPSPTPAPPANGGQPLAAPNVLVSEAEMPAGVRELLERRCGTCHTYGERDPSGWGSATDVSRMIASEIIIPGDPDRSRLWQRVAVRADMPYNGARLSSPEVQVLRAWIANLPRPAVTQPRTSRDLMDLVATDVGTTRPTDTRYISFAHFLDERRSPEELRAAGEVLALVLNSLSRRSELVKPEPIDPAGTIFRFRLSALGWSTADWDELVSFDPYCVRSDVARHVAVYQRLRTEAPFVRGDWFVSTASRPPLYHRLLDLPSTLDDLAEDLDVNIADNLNHPRDPRPVNVTRVGFRSSGVSSHNRIIDRHTRPNGGSLWVSYDFESDLERSDIRANPLGPDSLDRRNFNNTFQQAGGEIIFTLPNGLYGYMLVDAAGARIDLAPKAIVRDQRRPGGAVENGVSCISCHGVTGMNRPRSFDDIVSYAEDHRNEFSSQELQEIRSLYGANAPELLTADADRYLRAKEAVGAGRSPGGVIEYDAFINLVGGYEAKLGLRGAAVELAIAETTARTIVSSGRTEDVLPISSTDPLITRTDFACRFRSLVSRVNRNARFCANTFTAPEVSNPCP